MNNVVIFNTFTMLCKAFTALQNKALYPLKSHFHFPLLPATEKHPCAFYFYAFYLCWIFHIKGIIEYVIFCVWLLKSLHFKCGHNAKRK